MKFFDLLIFYRNVFGLISYSILYSTAHFMRLKSDFFHQKDFSNLVELVYSGSVELTKESVESLLQLTKVSHSNIRIGIRDLKFS